MYTQVRAHLRNGTYVRSHRRRLPDTATTKAAGGAGALIVALIVLGLGFSNAPATNPTTWQQAGLTYTATATSHDGTDCVDHAYGIVQQFLTTHTCTELARALYDTTDTTGDDLQVAVSWTTMPTTADANALKQLVDQSGTGNITELASDAHRGSVQFTGRYYDSHITGTTVVIAEAEPRNGSPTPNVLHQAATTALSVPRP